MAPKVRDFRTYKEEDYIPEPVKLVKTGDSDTCRYFDGDHFCTTRPSFNHPGEKSGLYCCTHKLDGMINVVSKKCIHTEVVNGETIKCNTTANYAAPGEHTKKYCGKHRNYTMVNPNRRKCIRDNNCSVTANYNYPSARVGIYCFTHKEPGMVNVSRGLCKYLDEEGRRCKSYRTFGVPNSNKREYCRKHKLEGMINIDANRNKQRECGELPSETRSTLNAMDRQLLSLHLPTLPTLPTQPLPSLPTQLPTPPTQPLQPVNNRIMVRFQNNDHFHYNPTVNIFPMTSSPTTPHDTEAIPAQSNIVIPNIIILNK